MPQLLVRVCVAKSISNGLRHENIAGAISRDFFNGQLGGQVTYATYGLAGEEAG